MGDSGEEFSEVLPESINLQLEKAEDLRYGENPHQQGARYRFVGAGSWLDTAQQHGGKQLSYLNLNDSEAAWSLACALDGVEAQDGAELDNGAGLEDGQQGGGQQGQSAAVIVKHANPCGVAIAEDIGVAWERAYACDPNSAFGGVVALSRPVDAKLAKKITENFLEVLIAPGFEEAALEVLAKKKNLRVIEASQPPTATLHFRSIDGGLLVQKATALPDFLAFHKQLGAESYGEAGMAEIVTRRPPTEEEIRDLAFAWVVVSATQSNAIVLAKNLQAVGIGAGQQNRKDAAMLAAFKADVRAAGSACASDAFFPFRDGLDQVGEAGCTAVIQPGGSIRDEEVIAAADEHNLAMIFTHQRRFLH